MSLTRYEVYDVRVDQREMAGGFTNIANARQHAFGLRGDDDRHMRSTSQNAAQVTNQVTRPVQDHHDNRIETGDQGIQDILDVLKSFAARSADCDKVRELRRHAM